MVEIIPPRARMSDTETENLLAAVGNHEAKCLTLIAMRSGNVFSGNDLYRTILGIQGRNITWRMGDRIPFNYCQRSLSPIGLVTKEVINSDLSIYGYQISDYGRKIGVPLAGHMLKFSEVHGIALSRLWGHTTSPSPKQTTEKDSDYRKRAPGTTLKIFYELVTSPSLPLRQVDISTLIGTQPSVVDDHLRRLSQFGMIDYSSKEVNTPYAYYTPIENFPQGEIPIFKKYTSLSLAVAAFFRNHLGERLSRGEVSSYLNLEGAPNAKFLNQRVSKVLAHFHRQGYIEVGKFSDEKQSEIDLTSDQRYTIVELIEMIDRVQRKDSAFLREGTRLAEEIISNPERVASLMNRAREASSHANQSPKEETRANILAIILSHTEGVTAVDIQKALSEYYDKRISIMGVRSLLTSLSRNNRLDVKQEGRLNRYFPQSK